MNDLIEALQIFAKYLKASNDRNPTHCEHDTLYIMGVGDEVSSADKSRLDELGFIWDASEVWISFRFGSA